MPENKKKNRKNKKNKKNTKKTVRMSRLSRTPHGLRPSGDGWFVLNAKDAVWRVNSVFGAVTSFEGQARFPQYGINLRVIGPGQPNCHYHAESNQEDFLVLSGRCRLLIEEQEIPLKAWDFVHCPPWTNHVFVGAGRGPCVILMTGTRLPHEKVHYPRSPLALKYHAGVEVPTDSPRVSYANVEPRKPAPPPAPFARAKGQ